MVHVWHYRVSHFSVAMSKTNDQPINKTTKNKSTKEKRLSIRQDETELTLNATISTLCVNFFLTFPTFGTQHDAVLARVRAWHHERVKVVGESKDKKK